MPWGVVAGALIGGIATTVSGNKAAGAQEKGSRLTVEEQRRQYDLSRQDQMPWLQAGNWALDEQKKYLQGDWSGFQNSPDYKAALDMGFKGLERGMAAGGALGSGGADADRMALGQQLATQYAGNYWQKLAGLSGTGQSSAQSLGGLGQNAANAIGNAYTNAGNARASAYMNAGNAWADTAQGLGGVYARYANQWRQGGLT